MSEYSIHIDVQFETSQEILRFTQDNVMETLLSKALKEEGHPFDKNYELSIRFMADTEIHNLNKTYRGKDKPTNVLSFTDMSEADGTIYMGDIAISIDTVKREVENYKIDIEKYTLCLILHGILHILGHDHEYDDEAEHMKKLEQKILKDCGLPNIYDSLKD